MRSLRPLLLGTLLSSAVATATPLGQSITISDNNIWGVGWYGDHEDNETEGNPTTLRGQQWDLEGMYLDLSKLTMVGGYDFRNGTTHNNITYRSGDLFIDTNGDIVYGFPDLGGSGKGGTISNIFGYDYVIDFNDAMTHYTVRSLTAGSTLARVTDVPASNAWRYSSGGTALAGYSNLALNYGLLDVSVYSLLSTYGSGPGLQGYLGDNNHYFLDVNVGFLAPGTDATFHYTMECGNDALMGHAHIPDGGSTILLLLGGLSVFTFVRRKFAA